MSKNTTLTTFRSDDLADGLSAKIELPAVQAEVWNQTDLDDGLSQQVYIRDPGMMDFVPVRERLRAAGDQVMRIVRGETYQTERHDPQRRELRLQRGIIRLATDNEIIWVAEQLDYAHHPRPLPH